MTNQTIIEDLTLVPMPVWWRSPWIWLGLVVLLAAGFYALYRWRTSRPVPLIPTPPLEPEPPPHLEALRRLEELRSQQAQLSAYAIATECSEILRVYIAKRFSFSILSQTTREFLNSACSHPEWDSKPKEELREFLHFFDRIKFAMETAAPDETSAAIEFAERFVRCCMSSAPST